MSVYLHDKINLNKIRFSSKPYKKKIDDKFIHFIDINYYKTPLYIQLPKCSIVKINEEDLKIQIKIDDYLYQSFIKQIEDVVVNTVYKNSELWFGKQYTMNKITNSLITLIQYKNDEYILEINYDKDTQFYNQYKLQLSVNDILLPNDAVCIIRLDNLQFINDKFTYNILLEQSKIFQKLRLNEYSIVESHGSQIESGQENIHLDDNKDNKNPQKISNRLSSSNSSSSMSIISDIKSNSDKRDVTTDILEDEYYLENK